MRIAKRVYKHSSQERIQLSDKDYPIKGVTMKKEERIRRGQSLDEINVDLAVKKLDKKVVHESPNIVNQN